jgi:hypothetical protein
MGRYRKVDIRIWNDATVRSLSPEGKLAWLFILTHPNLTSLGAFRTSISGLADELGMELKRFREGFGEGFSQGLFYYDEMACCLVIPRYLKYNPPENPNVIKSWEKLIDLIPECGLKHFYFQSVKWFIERLGEGFAEALPKPFRKGMPNPYTLNPNPIKNPPTPQTGGAGKSDLEKSKKRSKRKANQVSSTAVYSSDFEKFWSVYPNRRGGKDAAWKIWLRRAKAGTLPAAPELIAALEKLAASEAWMKEEGRFIPMVTTFLNQGRWTDTETLNLQAPPQNQIDPNCSLCHGRGTVDAEIDGDQGQADCECRRGKHES